MQKEKNFYSVSCIMTVTNTLTTRNMEMPEHKN